MNLNKNLINLNCHSDSLNGTSILIFNLHQNQSIKNIVARVVISLNIYLINPFFDCLHVLLSNLCIGDNVTTRMWTLVDSFWCDFLNKSNDESLNDRLLLRRYDFAPIILFRFMNWNKFFVFFVVKCSINLEIKSLVSF